MSFARDLERRARRGWRSIGTRLALGYSASLIAIALGLSVFIHIRLERDLVKEFDRFLRVYSADLADNVLQHRGDIAEALAAVDAEIALAGQAMLEYRIFDEDGRVLFSSPGLADAPLPEEPVPPVPAAFRTLELPGQRYSMRETSALLDLGDGRVWKTQTAASLKFVAKTLLNYRRNIAYVLLPLIAVGIAAGLFLARRALHPVAEMVEVARHISSTSLHRRLVLRGTGDELDDLADALNGMLARLDEAFQRIERFSSDLAHELRTPITQLKGETEAALMSKAGDAELRDLIARHAEIYDSIKNMITDLLSLIRAGSPGVPRAREPLDLHPLLTELVETFRPSAEEKGVRLEWAPPEGTLPIAGDRPTLARMISNVLDNAIRHTATGGSVALVGERAAGVVEVIVRDTGEGIAPEDLPHVFER
ncbi:MAG: HAMP domain-containing protein, partial [Planctomycetes bacterium]|nr:HAMP domain-containing protein [Planctomycetota bacterium]